MAGVFGICFIGRTHYGSKGKLPGGGFGGERHIALCGEVYE